MSTNPHTGARLFAGGYSKEGEESFDRIFRKNKTEVKPEPKADQKQVQQESSTEQAKGK